jgi:hypothetical protein
MNLLAKGLLIGCGGFMVLVAMVGVGGYVFYRSHGDEFEAEMKLAKEEGARAGAKLPGDACVDEALARLGGKERIAAGFSSRVWLDACLRASPTGFAACKGVPSPTEFRKTITWRKTECEARELGAEGACPHLMEGVQVFCAR